MQSVDSWKYKSGVSGKLKNVFGFWFKRCVDVQLFQEVEATKEIMICSLDKLECIGQIVLFLYFRNLIGARGGAEEASRARV